MAKILYGVAGEGMGHAIRSKVILDELCKENMIKVVASGKAHDYLKRYFDVKKIEHFKIVYRNNKAANMLTLSNNIIRLPIMIAKCLRIRSIIKDFSPDLVITDFEPFVAYFAFFKNIPLISIDNQHIITEIHHEEIPRKYLLSFSITRIIVNFFIIMPKIVLINAFYNFKIKNKNLIIVKPLLRENILRAKTSNKNNILVYQTSMSDKKIIKELMKTNERFVVYGFHQNKRLGNIMFRDFNEKEFYEDLSSCKAVITNGGFTLISEALYLKKPILSIPIKKQFEQIINAIYLEKLGYGMFAEEANKKVIEDFIRHIPIFRKQLQKYAGYDNKLAIGQINMAIKSLVR